jgi:hypothetical protein
MAESEQSESTLNCNNNQYILRMQKVSSVDQSSILHQELISMFKLIIAVLFNWELMKHRNILSLKRFHWQANQMCSVFTTEN